VVDLPRGGQNSREVQSTLPFLFWRVSLAALTSREPGELRVSLGDPWGALRYFAVNFVNFSEIWADRLAGHFRGNNPEQLLKHQLQCVTGNSYHIW
jgi:hypothetical protein